MKTRISASLSVFLLVNTTYCGEWSYDPASKLLTHDPTAWKLRASASGVNLTVTGIDRQPPVSSALPLADAIKDEYQITSISNSAFHGYVTGVTDVTIPGSVTNIDQWAFYNCGLTRVAIPNGVTHIGLGAFSECSRLTDVTISDSVTSIGSWAFAACTGLVGVTIGAGVTNIDNWVFSNCTSLTEISVVKENTAFCDIDGVLFSGDESRLVAYPVGRKGTYVIPAGVTGTGSGAFGSCTGLTGVTIPASVTNIAQSAFIGCTGLMGIAIPTSVTRIGGAAFAGCRSLTSVTFPNNVTSIEGWMFNNCTSLTNVVIPASVTSIGPRAFAHCTSLKDVAFNGRSVSTEREIFPDAPHVTVYIYATHAASWVTKLDSGSIEAGTAVWQGRPMRVLD